ncbi:hypothetical protein [Amycolatopsis sp. lyj-346]|uniref:hypothetical protein n=1 Tax=Amycolatopsis sp. lyj-346 TaxID=2789289 RepID=UPI00397C39D4
MKPSVLAGVGGAVVVLQGEPAVVVEGHRYLGADQGAQPQRLAGDRVVEVAGAAA